MPHSSNFNSIKGIGVKLKKASVTLSGKRVLERLDWRISPGSAWVIRGANGAGKTQLLRLLTAERWPDPVELSAQRTSTEASTLASDPATRQYDVHESGLVPLSLIRRRLLWVGGEAVDRYERFQWNFSIERVVSSGVDNNARPLNTLKPAQSRWVRKVLQDFGLWTLRRRRLLELSYGQRRWVLIARAFASDCGLIGLDEIFNGLDTTRRAAIMRLLPRWRERGVTLILALHSQDQPPRNGFKTRFLEQGRFTKQLPVDKSITTKSSSRRWTGPLNTSTEVDVNVDAAPSEILVQLKNASIYRQYKKVLSHLNLTIRVGEHWLIVGSNGCGKSTLLEAILGNIPIAYGGEIKRFGLQPQQSLRSWQARVGYVSPMLQADGFSHMSVCEVLVSGLRNAHFADAPIKRSEKNKALQALRQVKLNIDLNQSHYQLSYGQRRLLLLARALIAKPRLLLLDEPFTGLDQYYRQKLSDLLAQLCRTDLSLVLSVHHPKEAVEGITHLLNVDEVSVSAVLDEPQF